MRQRLAEHLSNLLDSGVRLQPTTAALRGGRMVRGTVAAGNARPPAGYSGHDYAVFLLHVAAEIEHALMVQYLYAAYSLGGPQVPEAEHKHVAEWQKILLGIAKEEMGHFVTVQNTLRLIGGPLNLERQDFPWDAPYTPFKFTLERLTQASLARYVFIESPETWPPDAEPYRKSITDLASKGQPWPPSQVGKLYALMIQVLGDHELVPEHLFQAETINFQASPDEWARGYPTNATSPHPSDPLKPDLVIQTMYSRYTAVTALQAVAEQGEAADVDNDLNQQSHFRRFFDIFKKFPDEAAGWSASRPLATNPTTVLYNPPIPGLTYIADPASRGWAELLNLRYRMLLIYLGHSFRLSGGAGNEQDGKARGMVLNNTVAEMYNLRAISRTIVQMPCGDPAAGLNAGPTFEMPYSVQLPQAESDVWQLHLDLLHAATPMVHELHKTAGPDAKRYLDDLAMLDRRKVAAIEAMLGGSKTRHLIRSFS